MKKTAIILGVISAILILGGAGCQNLKPPSVETDTNASINSEKNINAEINTNGKVEDGLNFNSDKDVNVDIKDNKDNTNDDTEPAPIPKPTPVTAPTTRTFDVSMQKFSFTPNTLQVNVGDTVVINATALDATHGINIPDYDFNLTVPQGETVTGSFVASKAGTFNFRCSVYCGLGHTDMTGTLIVK